MDKIKGLSTILMLKNENKFVFGENENRPKYTMLQQQLEFLQFCENIYICDGGSTDGSRDVYDSYDNVTYFEQVGPYDENRNLNDLLHTVKKDGKTSWVLYLDGDEILEDAAVQWLRNFTSIRDPVTEKITVRFNYINLWRRRNQYRKDKWYNEEAGKFFSLHDDLESFGTEFNNHHFAFGNPTNFGHIVYAYMKVLHYAWVDWNHILAKFHRCISQEMQFNGVSYEKSVEMYNIILNEEGIILKNCPPEWCK